MVHHRIQIGGGWPPWQILPNKYYPTNDCSWIDWIYYWTNNNIIIVLWAFLIWCFWNDFIYIAYPLPPMFYMMDVIKRLRRLEILRVFDGLCFVVPNDIVRMSSFFCFFISEAILILMGFFFTIRLYDDRIYSLFNTWQKYQWYPKSNRHTLFLFYFWFTKELDVLFKPSGFFNVFSFWNLI
jgi:hypothetical protein